MENISLYDISIIGSGHNALVSACYLAQAGKSVIILEKNNYVGGATTSQKTFPEFEAYLSRYSYLISLFPSEIKDELNLELPLLKRKIASYTPYEDKKGLLLSNVSNSISKESILALGFGDSEWKGYQKILQLQGEFSELIWDSFLSPLKSKKEWKSQFKKLGKFHLWEIFVENPIGRFIKEHVKSEVLRGLLLTDARIGAYTHAFDESLLQNKTFLYHIVGNKTGEWKVPKGGMGALISQLQKKAEELGVVIQTNAEVEAIKLGKLNSVYVNNTWIKSKYVLLNAAPQLLEKLIPLAHYKEYGHPFSSNDVKEGTAFKINILLKRLPKLNNKLVNSEEAFSGTFHINQQFSQQETSFKEADNQHLPTTFPCEMYCHTLTDDSILSDELKSKAYHTVTVFGMDMSYGLFLENNELNKTIVWDKFLSGINPYLAEPFEDCIAQNSDGSLCFECKSAVDLESDLGMPKGNIFHNDLSWFFAEKEEEINSWGVETPFPKVLICGSGAKRGGAVSGIPGRNAAMKVLEDWPPKI